MQMAFYIIGFFVAVFLIMFVLKSGNGVAKLIMWIVFVALAIAFVLFFVKIGWGGWLK